MGRDAGDLLLLGTDLIRNPDFQGVARAWRSRAKASAPDHDASIAQWVVNGPFHSAWSWWVVGLISLRDIPGVPPAHKHYPDAEYELMIVTINPDCCPPDPDAGDLKFLTPIDLTYQFDVRDEEAAVEIAELAVQAIVTGKMSPDQDYRKAWKTVLKATVDHYKQGVH